MFPSMFRVPVAPSLASTLAEYDLVMDGHIWSCSEVTGVRKVLRSAGAALVHRLADRLAFDGWVVAALPQELSDDLLHRAAAGVVAAAGTPFCPIGGGRALWLDGTGHTGLDDEPTRALAIALPDVTAPPDYASLLRLGPGPAGGEQVVVADLRSAAVLLADEDRDVLHRPVFAKDRSGHVRGVGGPTVPFPVLEDGPPGRSWIRWHGTLPADDRNAGHRPALERFASLLALTARRVSVRRGDLLIADQRRVAHSRTARGGHDGAVPSARWWSRGMARFDAAAPVQQVLHSRSAA